MLQLLVHNISYNCISLTFRIGKCREAFLPLEFSWHVSLFVNPTRTIRFDRLKNFRYR